ncbi:MAG: hypothetical protein LBI71_04600 [Enterobacteriaceae bacterium]|jgi:hypothetical protein|nr:hypothetical protein [Enterobacteriaceae bacterium]
MIHSRYLTYLGITCLLLPAIAQAQTPAQQLSSSQKEYLQQEIDKQVTDKSAMDEIQKWSDAKKIAEFVCRPLALTTIQQQHKDADKVFLGDVAPNSIKLQNAERLVGKGMYRTDNGWKDIRFSCKLDAATGKAILFKYEDAKSARFQTGPGPAVPPKQ